MTFLENQSEASLPPPRDSFPDACEAINDFWSMSGNFMYRHHVEPRVKLYSPREESFPVPLKHIDVARTTHTNLDVKQEKRIDDYWNIDGSRDLSDPCRVEQKNYHSLNIFVFFHGLMTWLVMQRSVWNDIVSWQTRRLNNSTKYLLHASMTTTSKKKK